MSCSYVLDLGLVQRGAFDTTIHVTTKWESCVFTCELIPAGRLNTSDSWSLAVVERRTNITFSSCEAVDQYLI